MSSTPTLGHSVHYKLTGADADAVNRRRAEFKADPAGRAGLVGNTARAGQVYPADVVASVGGVAVNLQVKLDGNDTYWVTSPPEGDGEGQWHWPERSDDRA